MRTREHIENQIAWKRDMLKWANGEYADQLEQDIQILEQQLLTSVPIGITVSPPHTTEVPTDAS